MRHRRTCMRPVASYRRTAHLFSAAALDRRPAICRVGACSLPPSCGGVGGVLYVQGCECMLVSSPLGLDLNDCLLSLIFQVAAVGRPPPRLHFVASSLQLRQANNGATGRLPLKDMAGARHPWGARPRDAGGTGVKSWRESARCTPSPCKPNTAPPMMSELQQMMNVDLGMETHNHTQEMSRQLHREPRAIIHLTLAPRPPPEPLSACPSAAVHSLPACTANRLLQ